MIDKTRLGIPLFDDRYGGIYRRLFERQVAALADEIAA